MNLSLWNFSLVLICIGLICLAGGLALSWLNRTRQPLDGVTTARVVDLVLREDGEQNGIYRNRYHAVLEYYVNGLLYKKELESGSYPSRYHVSQNVPICYDPSDPERFRVIPQDRYGPWSALLYTLGVILVVAGVFLLIRFAHRY